MAAAPMVRQEEGWTRKPRDPRVLPPDGDHGAECRWPPRPWFDKEQSDSDTPRPPSLAPPTAITAPSVDGRRAHGFDKWKGGPGNPGTPEFCPPTAITVPSADGRRARGSTRNRVTRVPRDPHTRHPGDPETPAPSPGESAQYAAYRLQQSKPATVIRGAHQPGRRIGSRCVQEKAICAGQRRAEPSAARVSQRDSDRQQQTREQAVAQSWRSRPRPARVSRLGLIRPRCGMHSEGRTPPGSATSTRSDAM